MWLNADMLLLMHGSDRCCGTSNSVLVHVDMAPTSGSIHRLAVQFARKGTRSVIQVTETSKDERLSNSTQCQPKSGTGGRSAVRTSAWLFFLVTHSLSCLVQSWYSLYRCCTCFKGSIAVTVCAVHIWSAATQDTQRTSTAKSRTMS